MGERPRTHGDMRARVAAADELVEVLSDVDVHALFVGASGIDVDIVMSGPADEVAARLGLTRDRWWLEILTLSGLFGQQWRGTWGGVEVTLRSYSVRPSRRGGAR